MAGGAVIAIVAIAIALLAYTVITAAFERVAPRSWVRAYRRFANPWLAPVLGVLFGWGVIETVGRVSGRARQTPVGGRLRGDTYWVVSADGEDSQYVKNIEANPKVRIRVHGRWRDGHATVIADDNPRRRLLQMNPLNSLFIWIAGTHLLTIRIDL